jgi:hypothetical protein
LWMYLLKSICCDTRMAAPLSYDFSDRIV